MQGSSGWFAWSLITGTLYVIIGVGFAQLATPSIVFWRLAAWVVSGLVYSAHIIREQLQARTSPHSKALHVALGAGVGAFGLAVAAIIHSSVTGTGNLRLLRIALLVWPLITGVPAYIFAWVLTVLLGRISRLRPMLG